MANEQKPRWSLLGTFLLVSIVVGALSGIVASIFVNQQLDAYLETLQQREQLVTISEVKPPPLPGTYEEALERVQEFGWASVATLHKRSSDSGVPANWFSRDDHLGVGAIVTSDGWIVFHQEAFNALSDPKANGEIWVRGKRYAIQSFRKDDLSQLAMVKIDARDLPTLAFGASESMKGGEIVFGLSGTQEILSTSLVDAAQVRGRTVEPAELFRTEWELSESSGQSAPLFNSSAELIGFSTGREAFPLHQGSAFIQNTLRAEEGSHAAVGAYTANIGLVQNIDPVLRQNALEGELIISPSRGVPALVAGGPLAQAGAKEGDVIVAIDDAFITSETTLAERLVDYEPQTPVRVSVLREGEQLELSVVLGDWAEINY